MEGGHITVLIILNYVKFNASTILAGFVSVNLFFIALMLVTAMQAGFYRSTVRAADRFSSSYWLMLIFVGYSSTVSILHYFEFGRILSVQYASLLLLMLVAVYVFSGRKIDIVKVIGVMHIILVCVLVISFVTSVSSGRLRMDLIGDRTSTASALAGAHLLFTSIYLRSKGKLGNFYLYASIFLGSFCVIYSLSRSIFLGLLILSIFFATQRLLGRQEKRNQRRRVRKSIILVSMVIAGSVVVYFANKYSAEAFDGLIDKYTFEEDYSNTASNRLLHLQYFLFLMGDDIPGWVLGHGYEAYHADSDLFFQGPRRNLGKTIHNMYLQYVLGIGLVGGVLLIAFIMLLFRDIKKLNSDEDKTFFNSLLIMALVVAMFQPTINSKIIFFFLPVLIHASRNSASLKRTSR